VEEEEEEEEEERGLTNHLKKRNVTFGSSESEYHLI